MCLNMQVMCLNHAWGIVHFKMQEKRLQIMCLNQT